MNERSNPAVENPLAGRGGLPRFDQIEPRHVVPGVHELLAGARQRLEEIEATASPSWAGVIEPLETLDIAFEYGWSPISHLLGVRNSPELRDAYETVLNEVVEFRLRLSQSGRIFGVLAELRDGEQWDQLDSAQQRIIERRLLDAELAGIGLDGEDRERFNEIERELSQLNTDFSNHVLDATKAWSLVLRNKADVDGLPASLLQLAAQNFNQTADDGEPGTAENGPWRISLDQPCYGPFMEHCRSRALREQLYRAWIGRAADGDLDNAPLIHRILKLRQEKAGLLGFDNYAQLSLARKMARDVEAVESMFERLLTHAWSAAEQDLKDLEELSRRNGQFEPLAHWDVAFWAERQREQRFDYADEDVRPYFSLERVLDGLFRLAQRLFGVTVTPTDGEAPVWHEDVRFFHVCDGNGRRVASFYLDPYSRPENKRGGAWMDVCLGRCRIDNAIRLPVAHLVCNQTPPVGDRPSLMTFREVETLFHEFGHGLQHMLTTVDYADAAGIGGVEWDAVELPSQFMENWCYHRPTLLGITAHFETGAAMPDELFEKILRARTYRAGSLMLRQLQFGMTDMKLHTEYDAESGESAFDVHRRVAQATSLMPPLPENHSLCAFQHIFAGGYAAGYYSYKWAEVLSADAFGAFEEAGLDDDDAVADMGRRFRDTVLAMGGSRHPMEVFRAFRGRDPDTTALLRHNGLL